MSTNKLSGRLQEIHASGDCGKCLSGLAEMAAALESERDALKAELEEARKQEPIGWILEISACLAPDDCEDYLEFYEMGKADAEELARYLNHGRAFQVYAKPVPAQASVEITGHIETPTAEQIESWIEASRTTTIERVPAQPSPAVAISKTETTTPAVAVPDGNLPCPWCGCSEVGFNTSEICCPIQYSSRARCDECYSEEPNGSGLWGSKEEAEEEALKNWNDREPLSAAHTQPKEPTCAD